MDVDTILAGVKTQMGELVNGQDQLGPRELAAVADAAIKIAKLESERRKESAELEKATSGIALFPTMPSDQQGF